MSEMGLHSSPRYLGAIPRKDLYTITQIMNNTRRGQTHAIPTSIPSIGGWLVFNGTFSTKKLRSCHAKSRSLLKILISDCLQY